jgi:O-antigen ligase
LKQLTRILSLVVAIAVLIQISFLEFNLGNAYYGILIVTFLLLLVLGKKIRFNYLMLWLVLAGFLSILLNDIPSFFQPYQRFIAFIFVMGLVGPLIGNTALHNFRLKLFPMLNNAILVLVTLSFFGITAGLPIMIGRGGFTGFFNHSMMLGPMASIGMLTAIHNAYTTSKKNKRWLFLGLAALAFVTSVAAGSRSALMAGVAGALFYYYKMNQGKITRFVRIIIVIVAIGIFSFPLWEPYTERIMGKMAYSEQQGDLLATRAVLWEIRIREFRSSPFIGVGFASVDSSILGNRFDATEGGVEPASSWLAVLSMTGLLGFIPLLLLTLKYIRFLFKEKNNRSQSAFLGGILFLFVVHMMAEGYVFAAGSGLFFYFWLLMGNIEIFRLEQHKNMKEQ